MKSQELSILVHYNNVPSPNAAVASQPCPQGHITANKREIKDFPKLPSAASFIRKRYMKLLALGKMLHSIGNLDKGGKVLWTP